MRFLFREMQAVGRQPHLQDPCGGRRSHSTHWEARLRSSWSPDGSLIVYYDASAGGAFFPARAIGQDRCSNSRHSSTWRSRGIPVLRGTKAVLLQGDFRAQDFWLVDLGTGGRLLKF